eukprot:6201099-Pleurochrysis_carterae.AAC.2
MKYHLLSSTHAVARETLTNSARHDTQRVRVFRSAARQITNISEQKRPNAEFVAQYKYLSQKLTRPNEATNYAGYATIMAPHRTSEPRLAM